MASATGLAYAVIVTLSILLLFSVLQLWQSIHVFRRQAAGTSPAPKRSIVLMAAAAVMLVLSYVFDISVTAITLVKGSETPPPTGVHLILTVITVSLGQGIAPALIFAAAGDIIDARVDQSGFTESDAWSARRRNASKLTDNALAALLPTLMIVYLSVFSKAVLDTPTTSAQFYRTLHVANSLYRAALIVHAALFCRLAMRALSFRARSSLEGHRDPVCIGFYLNPPVE